MKKVYALCILTIALVAADILLFHGRVAQAQGASRLVVQRVEMNSSIRETTTDGAVVGFSCATDTKNNASCYIALRP